jgi:hypothetical protein
MRLKGLACCSVSLAALMLYAAPVAAQAQDSEVQGQDASADQAPGAAADDAAGVEEIVVTGIRRSLQSAQNIRQRSEQIVDAVVAEDIGKLPDFNTAQTAARIPGVQVYRQGGEAQNVLGRGLRTSPRPTTVGRSSPPRRASSRCRTFRPPTSRRSRCSRLPRPISSNRACRAWSTSGLVGRSTSPAASWPARRGGCTRPG